MPRDGSDVYSLPSGKSPVELTTASAADMNYILSDIVTDLNLDRPVLAGGTGASTASSARTNLGLGNVDNTADDDKPISTATQAALDTLTTAKVATSRSVATGNGLTGGGDLSADRTLSVDFASQAEAEAGTATDKPLNALRVNQAIQALAPTRGLLIYQGGRVEASAGSSAASNATVLSMGSRAALDDANRIVIEAHLGGVYGNTGINLSVGLYVDSETTPRDELIIPVSNTYRQSVTATLSFSPGDTVARNYYVKSKGFVSGIRYWENANGVLKELAG